MKQITFISLKTNIPMKRVKCLSVVFIDGSEIEIWNDNSTTMYKGSEGYFAYELWKIARKDQTKKNFWLALFTGIVQKIDAKHKIVSSIVDHFEVERMKTDIQLQKAV